jgi:hypothetical protein
MKKQRTIRLKVKPVGDDQQKGMRTCLGKERMTSSKRKILIKDDYTFP